MFPKGSSMTRPHLSFLAFVFESFSTILFVCPGAARLATQPKPFKIFPPSQISMPN